MCYIFLWRYQFSLTKTKLLFFLFHKCRAVAAALFGTSQDRVEFRTVTASDRFAVLQSGEVDMLARATTHTMEREIVEVGCLCDCYCVSPWFE